MGETSNADTESCSNEVAVSLPALADMNPLLTHCNSSEFNRENCFTKGCKWAPDGSCILTNSEDNILRVWNLPPDFFHTSKWRSATPVSKLDPALHMKEGGLIYDYCWYPPMNSWDPVSCCLASVSRDSPTHLWDAFTGQLRATYRAYNQVDEVEAARSVAFDPLGQRLYCGFFSCLRVFDVSIPGRSYSTRNLKTSSGCSQTGIVSCITVSPAIHSLYAVGTYGGTIGLYTEDTSQALCILRGHEGGLTHLKFSSDGLFLYSGGRQDTEIVCWDLREPGTVLFSIPRVVKSHQRIYFDLSSDGKYLMSGTVEGHVSIWDTSEVMKTCETSPKAEKLFRAHHDCTNGVSVHHQLPILATCSGQRHNAEFDYPSDEEHCEVFQKRKRCSEENSLKLWWVGLVQDEESLEERSSPALGSPLPEQNLPMQVMDKNDPSALNLHPLPKDPKEFRIENDSAVLSDEAFPVN